MNRRDMIKTGGLGIAGFAVGTAATAPACHPKDLSSWVVSIVGAFGEIKPLLSELGLNQTIIAKVSDWIDKGVKIAQDFDAAYRAGKFKDALTLFGSLGDIVGQVAQELNVTNNKIVKSALIIISIARIAIATLLKSQAETQPVAIAEVAKAKAGVGSPESRAIHQVESLASVDLNKIAAAIAQ